MTVSPHHMEEKKMVNTIDFNKDIARDYGLRESVIATYLWELLDRDLESIERNGRVWTRISQRMITVALPFMSVDMARRSLKKLAEEGIIVRDVFNDDKFDHSTTPTCTRSRTSASRLWNRAHIHEQGEDKSNETMPGKLYLQKS